MIVHRIPHLDAKNRCSSCDVHKKPHLSAAQTVRSVQNNRLPVHKLSHHRPERWLLARLAQLFTELLTLGNRQQVCSQPFTINLTLRSQAMSYPQQSAHKGVCWTKGERSVFFQHPLNDIRNSISGIIDKPKPGSQLCSPNRKTGSFERSQTLSPLVRLPQEPASSR
jgi:hypothetical protein